MNIANIRARVSRLKEQVERESLAPRRKPTTAEAQQELDRFLAEIEARPRPTTPPKLSAEEKARSAECERELDRVLAVLNSDHTGGTT